MPRTLETALRLPAFYLALAHEPATLAPHSRTGARPQPQPAAAQAH